MRIRYSIRDSLLLTAVIALLLGWWIDRIRLTREVERLTAIANQSPAAVIQGRAMYADTGKPAVGVRVQAQAISTYASGGHTTFGSAVTDAEGRYWLMNLAPANYNIWAEADGWTMNAIESLPLEAGQKISDANLQLVKGGFIKGSVVDKDTGGPIAFAEGLPIRIGIYGPARPQTGHAVEDVVVNSDGEFLIRVPAGRNYPYIMSVLPKSVAIGREFQNVGVIVEDGKTTEVKFSVKSGSN